MRGVGYAQAYSFKYSPRPGTPAAEAEGQIEEAVKAERLSVLQDLLNRQQRAFNERFVGARVELLIEGRGRGAEQVMGRTPWMQAVHLTAPARAIGRLLDVEIIAAHANSLASQLVIACDKDGESQAA